MAAVSDDDELDASLQNILEQTSLKWIFVGGKGGVGKTTTSASLAIQLAKVRKSVLLISTDPAHNLSDAFSQKFTSKATPVNDFDNLFVMEIDPEPATDALFSQMGAAGESQGLMGMATPMLKELAGAFPGIDEAMSFAEVLKLVKTMEFDVVVFDTAPTGHTLRLLQFPTQLQKGLDMILGMKGKLSGIMKTFGGMMGGAAGAPSDDEMLSKLQSTKDTIEEVNKQFKNPDLTTFVCVMIPEFLSLYETERMIQELTRFDIDAHNIVINQVVIPSPGSSSAAPCQLCTARQKMQGKYIAQAKELYVDFHILLLPLLHQEVRGVPALSEFGKRLLDPSYPL
ncbi:MAG: TRC40/GET3/ArsA family transport-energizing ATPase [archaeon]|nr:TRC40/GET3/ArsA family transport-energizing ATPase [archaeon]